MNDELIEAVKNGSDLACREIIEKYSLMIYSIINSFDLNYGDYKISIEDLYQEGCIGLINACISYRKDDTAKFSTYAYLVIERRITRSFYQMIRPYKEEYSFDKVELIDHTNILRKDYVSDNPINYMSDEEFEDSVIDSIKFATKQDKLIMKLKANDYSYKEIADKLNITTKRVDNRINRLKRKYKQNNLNII